MKKTCHAIIFTSIVFTEKVISLNTALEKSDTKTLERRRRRRRTRREMYYLFPTHADRVKRPKTKRKRDRDKTAKVGKSSKDRANDTERIQVSKGTRSWNKVVHR